MLSTEIGYSYNDVTIVPSVISNVSSRSECNVFTPNDDTKLPIFASPMASVVSEENYETFEKNNIIPILPRIKEYDINYRIDKLYKGWWVAVSLKEFKNEIMNELKEDCPNDFTFRVCIDIANGHMKSLYDACCQAKQLAYDRHIKLIIMTGNIANAQTYEWICENAYYITTKDGYNYRECAIDYIRVGIGGGSGCITTSNVSIHYPQASLIDKCKKVKNEYENRYVRKFPSIVADGGIRNYDHVIKALALGADYVMIGSVFAQCIESAGEKTTKSQYAKLPLKFPVERYKDFSVDQNGNVKAYYTDEFIEENSKTWKEDLNEAQNLVKSGELTKDDAEYKLVVLQYNDKIKELKEEKFIGPICVKFFGMASADGQKSMNGEKTKTSEGITKWLPVKYTLKGWTENMISYLRSAMSYCNCTNIKEFIGKPVLIINSISEIQAVNK